MKKAKHIREHKRKKRGVTARPALEIRQDAVGPGLEKEPESLPEKETDVAKETDALKEVAAEQIDATDEHQKPSASASKEEAPADTPEPAVEIVPSTRRERRAKRKAQRKSAIALSRNPNIKNRMATQLTKSRKKAAKRLGTPDRNRTGLPVKRHPLRTTFVVLLSLGFAGLIAAFFVFDVPHWQRLDVSKITAAAQTGRMYDGNGELLMTIKGTQNRVVVPLSKIPPQTQQVFIAAEDLRFYRHHGIDFVRLFGAVAANLKEGGYAQGASTITMQLIRQSHLSTQKTIARKLEEMYLAIQLEQAMSKDEILAMYLNYIYFGSGAYGIQAAAQTYFGVDADELTLTQAAALAASIKAPSYYAPHVNEENNRSRRAYILNTMLAEGMIDQAAHDRAAKETLTLAEAPIEDVPYGWYVDAVLDEAETILGMSSEQVLSGGFTIDTALSRTHQNLLDEQFTKDLFPAKASDGTLVQGAAACVDIKTGEVLAIVGGRSYDVRRGFNRATKLRRQPGSSLKPLVVFAPAIDKFGYMTASVLKDEPTNFNGYKPRNSSYTYYGNVSIRSAITSSLNVSTVSLMNDIGVAAGRDYLTKVGIPLDVRDSNLALALGSMTYGVSPVQLAAAYAPFGNGGSYTAPHFIRKITDPSGRVLFQDRSAPTRVLKAQSAYLMTSMLQSVTSSGTGAKLSGANTPVAGKTGTVNLTGGGNRDIWMACYNSEISCAFWMGFDETDSSHKLQSWVSGGDNTAAMARDYFRALYQSRDKPQFVKPGGIISLEIDKQAIKWRGEPMLAVDLTPKTYRYTEVFTEDNHPTKKSDVWTPPRSPNRFTVGHSDAGYPLLMIQPSDTAIYRVQRDTQGESFVLTELYGSAGETLYYTDTSAKGGVVYTYRVIPVHAELLNNGILLEGVQAVQVAQAHLAAERTLWDDVKDFFGGAKKDPSDAVESMSENQQSIFWTH
ncbi:MAG: PBP1A family penicillin-binding protein [Eubacteriales bacterium]|nr:PBP1A family penicillin-binding protein [Eubacteriales bacterium]